ncbi:phosphoenolpyruvate--protein phosphotransferase [Lichenihabitans sp. Uapishka_5]|uniref:phosphoenolpyruvate--protein phosphotransferase n=1 Tax=Lichenihabitans sp. Uapishka_5 TaxID=3037302 RepID=UPI0029E7EC14|nr:phosphoenolpyruvate--protein phosphotransferase [Lichenihabitans sp. Uapishka_5]MDX7952102.1 phosphoenolpyruvate--protein phosphotransferase [Lichenihabitans sp. Uapishka_5]
MLERSVTVRVKEGLHARPATQFVKLAKTFRSAVELRRGTVGANAKSAVKLMLLGLKEGEAIVLQADGDDAAAALDALADFIETPEAGLDPAGTVPLATADARSASFTPPRFAAEGVGGVGASEGTAIGPAFGFFPTVLLAPNRRVAPEAVEAEIEALRRALDTTTAGLLEAKLKPGVSPQDTQILEALIEVARDAELTGAVETAIRTGRDALTATLEAGRILAETFEKVDNDYIRARAEDVRGVTRALGLALSGTADVSLARVPEGAILVAEEISAWDFAKAPIAALAGIVCTKGAATSHVAIMARTHGIPAVLGARADLAALKAATTVALDGKTGAVWLDPDMAKADGIRARVAAESQERDALDAFRHRAPVTRGGRAITVAANLGSLKEIEPALKAGAMGVGLFRTELLFMERKTLPSEDEQAGIYAELARAFAPHPVIVRTLDIGGDKPVAGIEFPHEDNPFLGWRGVRMCLDRPDVFKPQLKALLRAATEGNVKIMVPMVTNADEVLRVKALLAECRAELDAAGVAAGEPELGIMMETPAAALLADDLAKHAAFFSIGTNDLTQYVMAADRLNPRVADLNRADHPAVLKAVELICDAARRQNIWVGVCGEAAARPDLIPIFLRMGVTELSMSPASVPRAKKTVIEADEAA